MAGKATIRPADVRLEFGVKTAVSGAAGVVRLPSGIPTEPDIFRFNFGSPTAVAVSLLAEVKAGLASPSDRNQCDLQLMQFVTPRRYQSVYAGMKGGNTVVQYDGALENREFLDGNAVSTNDLTHDNAPFMSRTKAAAFRPTTGGHFINQCIDTPGGNEPGWVVVTSHDPAFHGAKHFLFRTDRFDEFLTIAVFIHPNGERQPIAMASWTCQHSYRFSWTQIGGSREIPNVVSGNSTIVQKSAPTTDPAALQPHLAKVQSPPQWILPFVNPQMTAAYAGTGITGKSRTSSPLEHPAVGSDFFMVQR